MATRGVPVVVAWLLAAFVAAVGVPAAGQFGGFGEVPQVEVSAIVDRAEVEPGGQAVIAVVMDHGETLHSWPAAVLDALPPEIAAFAIHANIELEETAAIGAVGPVQWPEPKMAPVPNVAGDGPPTIEVLTFKGRAIAYVPVLIAADAAEGEVVVPVSVQLQACDDVQCYMPQNESVEVVLTVTSAPATAEPGEDFAGFDASVFASFSLGDTPAPSPETEPAAELAEEAVVSSGVKFLGFISLPGGDSGALLWALIGAGLVGGFVLNLTPCVLPVIPIKVMTLTQHAGESRGRALVLGLWMFVGVVAFWSALALPVLLLEGFADPSQIFGYWYVTAGIGVLIFVMSFGLMGKFNISLPQKAYMVNPKADTASGSFLFGVMTAVLGLPCFGFIVGALLPAASASGAGSATAAVFVSMGVGMGAPYLVLAAFPKLVSRVPKTGPASDLVKQVMALLLMAAGAYFIGAGMLALAADMPYIGRVLHWWAVAGFVVAAGVWLVWRTLRITKAAVVPTGVFGLVALALSVSGVWVALNQTGSAKSRWETEQERLASIQNPGEFTTAGWNPYTPELASKAMDSGKVVVMDFTAEWCLNCKALKAAVLDVDPVKSTLGGEDVVAITVDLTSRSDPGWDRLSDLGQTGIPTLAVYGPGLDGGPWIANAYTSGQVLEAIERARGPKDDGPLASAD